MKLMVPVHSLQSCKAQIDAGTDEIYLGYRVSFFKRMSFSARPQIRSGEYIMPDEDEFREIIRYAKDRGISVKLTANSAYFSDYPTGEMDMEEEYIRYVTSAVDCGIDAVVISDIGLIHLINQLRLPVQIYASTLLDVDSISQMNFLKEIGVSRVITAYQITYKELECLAKNKTTEMEIFGYGGCSFGRGCILGHNEEFGIPCENEYSLPEDQEVHRRIFSSLHCALCSIWKLLRINIDSIKLIGREQHYTRSLPVTNLFRKAIDIALKSDSDDMYMRMVHDIIPIWWKRLYCDERSCKYESIPNRFRSISEIGGGIYD